MGWTWEVEAYVRRGDALVWTQIYAGQSVIKALRALRTAPKRHDTKCVRLVWRP